MTFHRRDDLESHWPLKGEDLPPTVLIVNLLPRITPTHSPRPTSNRFIIRFVPHHYQTAQATIELTSALQLPKQTHPS